jgi:predicted TPR repeat methyltransferase
MTNVGGLCQCFYADFRGLALRKLLRFMQAMENSNWPEIAQLAANEGRISEAVAAWREQLWLRPNDRAVLGELVTLYRQSGEIGPAIELLQAAIRRDYDFEQGHRWLGELFMELAEWDKAERHFTQAGDAAALEQLAQKRGALPASYARHLFNDYAPKFDAALAALGYRAPQVLATVLAPYLEGKTDLKVIDLGCGTGLMAPYLRAHAKHLVGVDIAEKMLELAQQRGGYDELIVADMLAIPLIGYDLVVAADALVYVGDLAPLLVRLPQGARFAASVEVNGHIEGFRLQDSKRYAHSQSYIEALCHAHNLQILNWQTVVLRQDRGQPIEGAVFVLQAS